LNGLNMEGGFCFAVIHGDVILSRVFCGEGPLCNSLTAPAQRESSQVLRGKERRSG
jgi:hypothetical protein